MSKLKDLIFYILKEYPHPNELSKARLNKIIYLCDWKHSIQHNEQISPIRWIYNHYGPYVDDIEHFVINDPDLYLEKTNNFLGQPKHIIRSYKSSTFSPSLESSQLETVNFVINTTKSLGWDDFIRLVYSTYPIIKMPKFSALDLVQLAKEYKSEIQNN